MTEVVIEAKNLVKDHVSHILRKRFRGVSNLNLTVRRGETYGLLGPNGAGKTTTQKLLLGLLKPTSGTLQVLGNPPGDPRTLEKIGYLPENPYFYAYLTAHEFLDFFGQLFSIPHAERRERIEGLLSLVSLNEVGSRPIRKFSKGMLQRLGLAQALINNPDLVFLDEPNSGLDPLGRRDIRKILHKLKAEGKTIFFNSHLLPDVSELCDRIGVLHRGVMIAEGEVKDICANGSYQNLEEFFVEEITKAEEEFKKSGKVVPIHLEEGLRN